MTEITIKDDTIMRKIAVKELRDRLDKAGETVSGPNGIPFWI